MLDVRKHAVEVSIVDGTAVTSVDQVFANPQDRVVEGTYIFPLEDDVAVSRFTMFVNGEEIEGKLLSVEEARRQYEAIVARMRDPALLEHVGKRMFRARIFPINPKSEVRIRLSYSQVLAIDNGLVRYRYPLKAQCSPVKPIESVSVLINVESRTPIKSVFSPSHSVAVGRTGERKASASYEAKNVIPDQPFELFYALSEKAFGLTVLTHRPHGQDGFFLLRIAPPLKTDAKDVLPKDIAFVIDTSGSMAGEKMEQAKRALAFCLANLNPQDRFNVIPFSHEAVPFRDTLVLASEENVKAARVFSDGLRATGGTNIDNALATALDTVGHIETDRPYMIVFLTDGQPTIGVTEPGQILKDIAARNNGRTRLFVFGVGYDVNTQLLDLLAEQNRGMREYVEPGEDLELALSSFYRKVAEPVLSDLALAIGDLKLYDMYPPQLGDLFAGGELVVVGRYKGEGNKAVELTGTRRGRRERFVDETTFPSEAADHDFLARLWATRKVGFLLDEIRLHGPNKELKDTVVTLATEYGIVTPYTAYLVTEPGGVATTRGERGNPMRQAIEQSLDFDTAGEGRRVVEESGAAMAPVSLDGAVAGRHAQPLRRVRASRDMSVLKLADVSSTNESAGFAGAEMKKGEASQAPVRLVQRVAGRTFYRVEDCWIDAAHRAGGETTKVELFSEAYFGLIRKHPELAGCFALGERVVVVVGGVTYETVPTAGEGR